MLCPHWIDVALAVAGCIAFGAMCAIAGYIRKPNESEPELPPEREQQAEIPAFEWRDGALHPLPQHDHSTHQ